MTNKITREEAIQELQNCKGLIQQDGQDYLDERDIPLLNMAIEALSEPINCVKCKHYYETEDDTNVHGHCKMDTAHTNLISKEEAIEMLKALNMMLRNPDGEPISDVCEAIDMATEALSVDVVQGWIPCSERLPKKGEVVLITNGKGNVRCGQYRSEHDVRGDTHYWWWKGKTVESVLAWMPLPKPYKGGDAK